VKSIKVLVVDDSAFMRKIISDIINSDPELTVIGTAANGIECLAKITQLNPDLVTLDIEMPVMDGLTTLRKIMKVSPLPVLMVSSLTKKGAEQTINALNWGAVDFITKPSPDAVTNIDLVKSDLLRKIRTIAGTRNKLPKLYSNPNIAKPTSTSYASPVIGRLLNKLVLMGTSTGGPRALHQVLPGLPANLDAGILIVQHMPPGFTKSLAERLDSISKIKVKEAEQGEEVRPGCAYIAPGDYHLTVSHKKTANRELLINLSKAEPLRGHRPSVDVMLDSVAAEFRSQMVCVIMTGMGQDGSQGIINIKNRGGKIIAQDQSTSIIYGMPRAAVETGKVDKVVPLPQIADEILRML
jgi:two-component system chemotaxis response regulator CheB